MATFHIPDMHSRDGMSALPGMPVDIRFGSIVFGSATRNRLFAPKALVGECQTCSLDMLGICAFNSETLTFKCWPIRDFEACMEMDIMLI